MQNHGVAQPTQPSSSPNARREFALILVLFLAFRMMTLLAFRPGGQVLDHSDFYWYREFAQLTRQGYIPYDNLPASLSYLDDRAVVGQQLAAPLGISQLVVFAADGRDVSPL